jgi:signal peptidase I
MPFLTRHPEPTDEQASATNPPSSEHPFTEIVRFALIAVIIVVPIRMFVAQPFIVSGASMEQTFENGQYLIVDQLTYHFDDPARGDVVIFRYPKDPTKFFIKRIIGLPGDTVSIRGNTITITNDQHPGGAILAEPYVAMMSGDSDLTERLGEGEYFVMGDNRDFSSDSRAWGILTEDKIVGRALVRLFPVGSAALWPGKYEGETLLVDKE